MGELGLGTLPVRRDDGRIRGVLSRDMVIACIAEGGDPASVTATDIAQPMPSAGDAQAADILVEPDLDTGQGAGASPRGGRGPGGAAGQVVAAALQSLPPESRLLVYLADVVGLAYQQSAGITGLPGDAVAAHLHCGRRQLRARLATCDRTSGCPHDG